MMNPRERGEHIQRRRHVLTAVLAVLFAIAVFRLFNLQILNGSTHRDRSERNRLRKEVLHAPRGRILDRHERVLVDNFASFVVTLDPYDPAVRDRRVLSGVVGRLAPLIDRDSTAMWQEITASRRRSFLPVRLERNLTEPEVARVAEAAPDLPGVAIRVEPVRNYPHGTLAAHVLGTVGEIDPADLEAARPLGYEAGDVVGKSGLEEQYDVLLHGHNGVRYVEVDAFGRARRFSTVWDPERPVPGDDLVLTLDLDLQRALEAAVDSVDDLTSGPFVERGRVVGGAALLDVRTGDLLASVSRPAFDPNAFAAGMDEYTWSLLRDDPDKPLLNRVVQSRYPPGSIYKMLVAVAAIDSGFVQSGTVLKPCLGAMRYGERAFRCWRAAGHGALSLTQSIEQSCDVYFYQLGDLLGVNGLAHMAHRFRIGDVTGIDLPGERPGLIPDETYLTSRYGRRGWSRGAALNLAIGQGELLTTPIQLLVHTAVLANGGDLVTPTLCMATRSPDGEWNGRAREGARPILGDLDRTLTAIRAMMRGVIEAEDGTGHNAAVKGLTMGGKTGTSQNPHGADHALFTSYVPAEDPELALVVVLERRGHGGAAAAPVAAAFWRAYVAIRNGPMAVAEAGP